MNTPETIIEKLTWRRAIRAFDMTKKVTDADLKTILESAHLSPSSYGTEPWKFLVITDPEIRAKLQAAGYGQPKIAEASHLIVITRRTDTDAIARELVERTATSQNKATEELAGFKGMVEGAIAARPEGAARDGWLAAQTYISLGIMVATASLLNIDNGPMEGFDIVKVNEILGLSEKKLSAVTMLALGYRRDDPTLMPKVRRSFDDVVEFI
jgi:nitroreductase